MKIFLKIKKFNFTPTSKMANMNRIEELKKEYRMLMQEVKKDDDKYWTYIVRINEIYKEIQGYYPYVKVRMTDILQEKAMITTKNMI